MWASYIFLTYFCFSENVGFILTATLSCLFFSLHSLTRCVNTPLIFPSVIPTGKFTPSSLSLVKVVKYQWRFQNLHMIMSFTDLIFFNGSHNFLSISWNLLSSYYVCMCSVIHSCPTLCDPMDYSPSGSSVRGIFQARTLEWVAISFSTSIMYQELSYVLGCQKWAEKPSPFCHSAHSLGQCIRKPVNN